MRTQRVAVVGAGVAGLVAAIDLARRGLDVSLLERGDAPGGKMRQIAIGRAKIDAGPTVLTMRQVFEDLFDDAGTSLETSVAMRPVEILARHAWSEQERLDLFPGIDRSADAIARFSGPAEARRYRRFCHDARAIHDTLESSFIRRPKPSLFGLVGNVGITRLGELWRIRPFTRLWSALGGYFHDPRLRQLFGRYATYVGASPFRAPATLMLIAHVEREGVWQIEGGMHQLALALASLAEKLGASIRYGVEVREIEAEGSRVARVRLDTGEALAVDAVVLNTDVAAVAGGRLGGIAARAIGGRPRAERSQSAITWSLEAKTTGFPLCHHNVFFSSDYRAEFDDVFGRSRTPRAPTVYVCAQDRDGRDGAAIDGPERLFCLVNAPAAGDGAPMSAMEIQRCEARTFDHLSRCGLDVHRAPETMRVTTPHDFERLFPGTGGALYGPASHGWQASFRRRDHRTGLPGLYMAGGSTHPGPGVPMAAISGRLAAAGLIADLASTATSRRAVTSGGTSMRRVTTGGTDSP